MLKAFSWRATKGWMSGSWEVEVKPKMYVSTFKLELVKTFDDNTQWNRLRNCTEDYSISEELFLP